MRVLAARGHVKVIDNLLTGHKKNLDGVMNRSSVTMSTSAIMLRFSR